MPPKPLVGISSCLLGEAVRYDGGHARHPLAVGRLGDRVEWVCVCPEVELGLGVPREPIQIEREGRALRLRTIESRRDLTADLEDWARKRLAALEPLGLCGFVLKARSPSCGWGTAPVLDLDGEVVGHDDGRFAHVVRVVWPDLPVVDEGTLDDPVELERFLAAVFAYCGRPGSDHPDPG